MVRIGVIIGEGHDDLIEDARRAAEKHEIELRVQVTHSDQETLYFFRRMVRDIDGFWLFPDNRILSGRVLQEMLADANRQQVPVTVPSDSMLQLGATLEYFDGCRRHCQDDRKGHSRNPVRQAQRRATHYAAV